MSNSSTVSTQSRRSFFKKTAAGAAVAIPSLAVINGTEMALAGPMPSLNDGDVAVLQFLAVAELVEGDLWGQYCELATNNPGYRNALQKIDESLPDYICGVLEDECSHATGEPAGRDSRLDPTAASVAAETTAAAVVAATQRSGTDGRPTWR